MFTYGLISILNSILIVCSHAQSNVKYLDKYDSCTGCLPLELLINTDPSKIQADLTIKLLSFAAFINDSRTRLEWTDFVTSIVTQETPTVSSLLDYTAERIESFLLLQKNQQFAKKINNISFDWCQNVSSIRRLYSLASIERLNTTLNCIADDCPLYQILSSSYPPYFWLHYDYSIFVGRLKFYLLDNKLEANERLARLYEEMIQIMRRNYLLRDVFLTQKLDGYGTVFKLFIALRKIYPTQRIQYLLGPSLIDPKITIFENNLRIVQTKTKYNVNATQFDVLSAFIDRWAHASNPGEIVSIYNDLKEVDPNTVELLRSAQIHELFTFGDLADSLNLVKCALTEIDLGTAVSESVVDTVETTIQPVQQRNETALEDREDGERDEV